MKEFKFYSDEFEFPVSVCKTQKEAVYEITSAREALKLLDKEGECEGGCEKLIIDVIYKDGSTYYNSNNYAEEGKFKRTGIARAIVSTEYGTVVFGDFAITEYGDVTIEESEIEEYGVYAGQYDVKEQEAQEVQETVEQTVETIAEGTSEVETTEQAQAEENKDTFEYRNYIISGNERTGIIAIDNHGNFSPKVYKTVEEAKKAVDEDIEYAEKKYAEMEAEQTEVEETDDKGE